MAAESFCRVLILPGTPIKKARTTSPGFSGINHSSLVYLCSKSMLMTTYRLFVLLLADPSVNFQLAGQGLY